VAAGVVGLIVVALALLLARPIALVVIFGVIVWLL
jgi:hypothetical protein